MKKMLFNIGIIAAVLFYSLLNGIVSRSIIEYRRDIYVNRLISKYQPSYPMITQKNLVSVQITSEWKKSYILFTRESYIHLEFEDSTAEINITARVFELGLGESWILYESKL